MSLLDIEKLFYAAGGIGMFLYGMHLMAAGLQKAAGARMKRLMGTWTSHCLAAVLVGKAGHLPDEDDAEVSFVAGIDDDRVSLFDAVPGVRRQVVGVDGGRCELITVLERNLEVEGEVVHRVSVPPDLEGRAAEPEVHHSTLLSWRYSLTCFPKLSNVTVSMSSPVRH